MRRKSVDTAQLLERLAAGDRMKVIAADLGVEYPTLRQHLSRHMRANGIRTPEEAVARHVTAKLKAGLL